MGRVIRRSYIGTHKNFLKNLSSFGKLRRVRNADVYWGDDGTLVIVTSQKWADYFCGRVSEPPTKETVQDEFAGEFDGEYEFDEQKFSDLWSGRTERVKQYE